MILYNSLNIYDIIPGDSLYLIRYSQKNHPDFIVVKYKGQKNNKIKCLTKKGIIKNITIKKACYRLFSDIDEMSRSLYECFIRRNINIINDYKKMILVSQDNRPELWV